MRLQETIHKLFEGAGARWMGLGCGVIALLSLAMWYDLAAFKNLSTVEGMDAAQLARNLADGRGYTTDFIRPFSLHLLRHHQPGGDWVRAENHPDLANPPLYPVLLAAALKCNPFGWPNVIDQKSFSVYRPDLWIAFLNQALFLIAVGLVFRLARILFDEPVAWVSAAAFAGAELYWRFSISGQSTSLLIVLVLLVCLRLVRIETEARRGVHGTGWFAGMSLLTGILVGLCGLTRYASLVLAIPVLVFLASVPGTRKNMMALSAAAGCLLVMTPWVVRNFQVSGTPFGTAGYAACEGTGVFPDPHQLERTLAPDYTGLSVEQFWSKTVRGVREIVAQDLPRLGGSWVSAFFLVGLLIPFRNPLLGRLRGFLLGSLVLLVLAQAVGKTALSTDSPEVNSENLLAIVAPIVFIFGVGLFFTLLEPFSGPMASGRYSWIGFFCILACAPLLLSLLQPARNHVAYPPYYPPWLQDKASLVPEHDWIMSDIPWAMAWYGHRPSVWLTLKYRQADTDNLRNDFYAVYKLRPIRALHLSTQKIKSLEVAPLTDWIYREKDDIWDQHVRDWDSFILVGPFVQREVPTGFPLRKAPRGLLPELFLIDSERGEEKAIQSR